MLNTFIDIFVVYGLCGVVLVTFLQYNELFFFTSASNNQGQEVTRDNAAIYLLMRCIDLSIFGMSILVWPLLLLSCLNVEIDPEDDFIDE